MVGDCLPVITSIRETLSGTRQEQERGIIGPASLLHSWHWALCHHSTILTTTNVKWVSDKPKPVQCTADFINISKPVWKASKHYFCFFSEKYHIIFLNRETLSWMLWRCLYCFQFVSSEWDPTEESRPLRRKVYEAGVFAPPSPLPTPTTTTTKTSTLYIYDNLTSASPSGNLKIDILKKVCPNYGHKSPLSLSFVYCGSWSSLMVDTQLCV